MKKLKPEVLRKYNPDPEEVKKIKRNPVVLVLDRIVDTYNIGSIFRLADAIAAQKMILAGDMEHPPNHRIHKASVGTHKWVPWEKKESTEAAVKELKKQGYFCLAIEQDKKSINYKDLVPGNNGLRFPVAVILGHETEGLEKSVLKEADLVVELPMYGVNNSFNVWGSAAVVCYKLLENLD